MIVFGLLALGEWRLVDWVVGDHVVVVVCVLVGFHSCIH